jgi:CHAD domain-containing protein
MSVNLNSQGDVATRAPSGSPAGEKNGRGYSRTGPINRDDYFCNPGLAIFASQQLLPRLDAVSKEIVGIRAGEDIEYLHRMRVASRRLRAALPVFAPCLPRKKYGRWLADIRRITRVLGDARDADVQIAALRKYRKKVMKSGDGDTGGKKPGDEAIMEGLGYLLSKTRERRTEYQKEIISALSNIEKHHVIEEIRESVVSGAARAGSLRKKSRMTGIPPTAVLHIGKGIDKLLMYDEWVKYPDAVAEHHAMRIAAKQLRYMMELYSPLYRRGLKKPISQVTRLQEILGELHDCDVWIDRVTYLLLKERTKPRVLRDSDRPGPVVIAGLKQFLTDREKERRFIYRRFSRRWESLSRAGAWQATRTMLVTGAKTQFIARGNFTEDEALQSVRDLARAFTPGIPHASHVGMLALALFDSLSEVHGLNGDDRLLLESAALLHEIGFCDGRKGHPERGAAMILSDEYLPYGIPERCIIALSVANHRTKADIHADGLLSVLPEPARRRALLIASLLRIADGLDVHHNGEVSSVASIIKGKQVVLTIASDAITGPDQLKVLAKADLFTRVSGYTVSFGPIPPHTAQ